MPRATSDQVESPDRIKLLAKTMSWSIVREPMRTDNALVNFRELRGNVIVMITLPRNPGKKLLFFYIFTNVKDWTF